MPWRGPAGAQRPPHGGNYFSLGNERAKPLVFLLNQTIALVRRAPRRAADQREAPSHGATQMGYVAASRARDKAVERSAAPPSKRARARRSSGKSRGESASGLAQKRRALRSAQRGTECVLRYSRSSSPLPIVTRMGRDYRPGLRQRIERVARRAAHIGNENPGTLRGERTERF
jgi:hypothetical protein